MNLICPASNSYEENIFLSSVRLTHLFRTFHVLQMSLCEIKQCKKNYTDIYYCPFFLVSVMFPKSKNNLDDTAITSVSRTKNVRF